MQTVVDVPDRTRHYERLEQFQRAEDLGLVS